MNRNQLIVMRKTVFQSYLGLVLGITGIFLLSLGLRFWGLSRFNTLVFDEVYFAKFAHKYLTGLPLFDAQPPLGKYIIALGIWLNTQFPFGDQSIKNQLAGQLLSPFSYRWMNALTGSLIPVIVAAIAWQISHRKSYAFIASLMMALDGLFLVESRYSLINLYLVIFGLLGQWFVLLSLNDKISFRVLLTAAGVCFGASAAVKWNGLGFLLGTYGIWAIAWIDRLTKFDQKQPLTLLKKITKISALRLIFYLGIIPIIVYGLAWIPHLQINSESFFTLHQQILTYHQKLGNSPDIHHYCSSWWTWVFMIRPMAYFYQKVSGDNPVIYDVHAMGNPILWWLGTASIILLIGVFISRFYQRKFQIYPQLWIGLFVVVNYAANLLPWIKVDRCLFIYHYMSAAVYSFMAIALFIDQWINSENPTYRRIGYGAIALISLAFIFWLPIYLGLPLTPLELRLRMWFPTWI